jgi:DNA-3-methyladenine glycosylase
MHTTLSREFYQRPVVTVARQLLGKVLVRHAGSTTLSGLIVEVEAYNGTGDPASHSYKGKTIRNEVMFREGGVLYVYFTYGMHFCANVVTGDEGDGCAVLVRAVEPLEGIPAMARRRERPASAVRELCSGPAKLCQAFGIGKEQNGTDLTGDELWIEDRGTIITPQQIVATPRIGISQGKDKLWRFALAGNPFLSRPVR